MIILLLVTFFFTNTVITTAGHENGRHLLRFWDNIFLWHCAFCVFLGVHLIHLSDHNVRSFGTLAIWLHLQLLSVIHFYTIVVNTCHASTPLLGQWYIELLKKASVMYRYTSLVYYSTFVALHIALCIVSVIMKKRIERGWWSAGKQTLTQLQNTQSCFHILMYSYKPKWSLAHIIYYCYYCITYTYMLTYTLYTEA